LFLRFVAPALGFNLAWPWYALVGAGTLVLVGAAFARGTRGAAQP
jgi:hypothetical protein